MDHAAEHEPAHRGPEMGYESTGSSTRAATLGVSTLDEIAETQVKETGVAVTPRIPYSSSAIESGASGPRAFNTHVGQ
jgi:hypothetical protein